MEGLSNLESKTNKQELRESIIALKTLEAKYQRGEVGLNLVVYGINEIQKKFFTELQARGIITEDINYRDHYQAAINDEGDHYTKIISTENEVVIKLKTPEERVIELINKIGPILSPEITKSALDNARHPDVTEEEVFEILSNLLSLAIAKLNKS